MHAGDWLVYERNEGILGRGLGQAEERVEERVSSRWCDAADKY